MTNDQRGFYLRTAAAAWLQSNPGDLNAPRVREALEEAQETYPARLRPDINYAATGEEALRVLRASVAPEMRELVLQALTQVHREGIAEGSADMDSRHRFPDTSGQ